MIYCTYCQQPIEARSTPNADTYIHRTNHSPYCDAPDLETAVENGYRRASLKQGRPDLSRVTLREMRELAPIFTN